MPTKRVPPSEFEAFEAAWEALYDQVKTIRTTKRHDYTDERSQLYNYERSAEAAGVSVELIMLSRMQEKLTRVSVILQRGGDRAVLDESVQDSLVDIANIAFLIGANLSVKPLDF